jgi:hypothetical protein
MCCLKKKRKNRASFLLFLFFDNCTTVVKNKNIGFRMLRGLYEAGTI